MDTVIGIVLGLAQPAAGDAPCVSAHHVGMPRLRRTDDCHLLVQAMSGE